MFIKFAEEPSDDPRDIAAYGSNRTAGRLRADETHYTNSIKVGYTTRVIASSGGAPLLQL
jgi:hypothetical protein